MERRIVLVDAFNTSNQFELSVAESMRLFRVDAIEFCLKDSLNFDFIAVHVPVNDSSAYRAAVETISSVREATNPLTGEEMKIITLFPPQSRANSN